MLKLPPDFEDYAWEVEAKGWFGNAQISISGKTYRLTFFDPVRLAQEIESELQLGSLFMEANLVVVESVTKEAMGQAADELVRSKRINCLVPD